MRVSFLGRGSSAAANRLAEILERSELKCPIVITPASGHSETDVLVVLSSGNVKRKMKCKMLVAAAGVEMLSVRYIRKLSCGMSCEDDITASSVGEGECVAAVRREIKTLNGKIIDRCEMCVKRGKGLSPEALLAVLGCALMLDVPTDKII